MKGVIADCLCKLVTEKFGKSKWQEILKSMNIPENQMFLPSDDIEDKKVMDMINATCKVLNLTALQAADVFGEYWVNSYALKIYGVFFQKHNNAKDFIKGMESVHDTTTKSIPNAHPPRFEFKDIDKNTLLVTYKSQRNLIDFYIGLIKGVAVFFKTSIKIQKLSDKQVQLTFAA